MYIDHQRDPVAGQTFTFTLVEAQPPVELVYYVGNRPYGEETCEEAPCELVVMVPAGTDGEFLRLVVQDAAGSEEYRLRIGEAA